MQGSEPPKIVVIAGSNGAGKTTISRTLLPQTLHIRHFVNADLIAAGLSPFDPAAVDFQAGELMLRRIRHLAEQRENFAFETTLSSRSYARFLAARREEGYFIHLLYVWLSSPELAIARVSDRVRRGGHNIPSDVIRRRYPRTLKNLFELYLPQADTWTIVDNSETKLDVIAECASGEDPVVYNQVKLAKMRAQANDS